MFGASSRARPSERGVWEAKRHAEKARLAKFVREESCGFANRRGGYLVLGAEEGPDAAWHLSGVEVPGVRELHDWVSSLMTALDPLPDFDVHEWRLSNGRRVEDGEVLPAR
jgi:predicted HTH transcriptional regulator